MPCQTKNALLPRITPPFQELRLQSLEVKKFSPFEVAGIHGIYIYIYDMFLLVLFWRFLMLLELLSKPFFRRFMAPLMQGAHGAQKPSQLPAGAGPRRPARLHHPGLLPQLPAARQEHGQGRSAPEERREAQGGVGA